MFVDLQSPANGLFVVIGAVMQHLTGFVVPTRNPRWFEVDVVDGAARGCDPPSGEAFHQDLPIDIHQQCKLQRLAQTRHHGIQGLGLRDVARETIEDKSALGIGPGQAVLNDAKHHIVAHQLTSVHGGLGSTAKLGTRLALFAQNVARRDLRDFKLFDQ